MNFLYDDDDNDVNDTQIKVGINNDDCPFWWWWWGGC